MLRTTVRLPEDLLGAAKDRARQTGRTLTQLLESALRAELATGDSPPSRVAERSPAYQARATQATTNQPFVESLTPTGQRDHLMAQVDELQQFLSAQPDLDRRSPDEILGFDAHGLPG